MLLGEGAPHLGRAQGPAVGQTGISCTLFHTSHLLSLIWLPFLFTVGYRLPLWRLNAKC